MDIPPLLPTTTGEYEMCDETKDPHHEECVNRLRLAVAQTIGHGRVSKTGAYYGPMPFAGAPAAAAETKPQ